jgi:hypothetical protein
LEEIETDVPTTANDQRESLKIHDLRKSGVRSQESE